MKQKIIAAVAMLFVTCILSTKTFAQRDAGGSAGDPSPTTQPDLSINLGAGGVIEIPATSSYYSFVTTLLSYFHVTIQEDGTVVFPTRTCYSSCLSGLYYTRCINYSTYQTACKTPPSGCR